MPDRSDNATSLAAAERSVDTAAWLRPVFGALSPAGARGRLTILIFHHVHTCRDDLFPNEVHAETFRERMRWIRGWFNVLPLEEATAALRQGTLPGRALAITFDDGYADNCAVALPILRELSLHATFFIASRFLDGGRMWNDTVIETVRRSRGSELDLAAVGLGRHGIGTAEERRDAIRAVLAKLKYQPSAERQAVADAMGQLAGVALPDSLMLTRSQLRDLAAAGMGIGGHTASHPILARLDEAAARREIAEGRETLEEIVRQPIRLFAYPNGKPNIDYTAAHVRIARELGFTAAVSTASGAAHPGDTGYELPRFTPWDQTPVRWGLRLARNLRARVETAAV
jgi:peptidoglycan/xylan/chitin deacetylase (PgdA/CDA1 family)